MEEKSLARCKRQRGSFRKQIKKDIEILANKKSGINKIEWHLLNGIDENAIKFITKLTKDNEVLDKIIIILY